jgi:hypothetical protein
VWVVDPISGDKADLKSRNDAEKSCMHMIAYVDIYIYLVDGLEPWIFMTFHILGIIIPTAELIFFRGVETTNQIFVHMYIYTYCTCLICEISMISIYISNISVNL